MAQHSTFSTGGGVVHKATLPGSRMTFSFWYDASGEVTSAEGRDSLGRYRTADSFPLRRQLAERYSYLVPGRLKATR